MGGGGKGSARELSTAQRAQNQVLHSSPELSLSQVPAGGGGPPASLYIGAASAPARPQAQDLHRLRPRHDISEWA